MNKKQLKKALLASLEDMKAENIVTIDVSHLTSSFDEIIICSGTSNRHVKSIADKTYRNLKTAGITPLSVEGDNSAEWVLMDYVDIILHIMKPEIRDYYQIEKLWQHEIESGEFMTEPPPRI